MVASAVAGGLGLAGSFFASEGAEDAANAEARAAAANVAFQREALARQEARAAPFVQAGVLALQDIADILGLGGPPLAEAGKQNFGDILGKDPTSRLFDIERLTNEFNAKGGEQIPSYGDFIASRGLTGPGVGALDNATRAFFAEFGDKLRPAANPADQLSVKERQENALSKFRTSPGFQFQLEQGQQALDRSAAARGQLLSGRGVKETQRFGQGLAQQDFGNFFNRLAGVVGLGQATTNQINVLGQNAATNIGNALSAEGAARASGIVGQTNALTSGLSGLGQAAGFGLGNSGGFGFPGTTGPIVPNQLSFFSR